MYEEVYSWNQTLGEELNSDSLVFFEQIIGRDNYNDTPHKRLSLAVKLDMNR